MKPSGSFRRDRALDKDGKARGKEAGSRAVRTELIRGIVIDKRIKTPMHSSIASLLERTFTLQVPPEFCIRKDGALTLRDSEPEPDLAIVSGNHEDYFHAHPSTAALAVEVAVTSPDDDRALAEIYAEAGVGAYWVVLPKERAIEVARQPRDSPIAKCTATSSRTRLCAAPCPA